MRGGYERIGQPGSPYPIAWRRDRRDPQGLWMQAGCDRLQGRAWRADLRRGPRDRRSDRDDGAVCRRRAAAQPALYRGDEGVPREAAGRAAGGGVRDGVSSDDSAGPPGLSPSRTSGPKSSASADTDFTARPIATSRTRVRGTAGSRMPGGSSVAISAARARSARSKTARSSPTRFGMTAQSGLAAQQPRWRLRYLCPA